MFSCNAAHTKRNHFSALGLLISAETTRASASPSNLEVGAVISYLRFRRLRIRHNNSVWQRCVPRRSMARINEVSGQCCSVISFVADLSTHEGISGCYRTDTNLIKR